MPQRPELRVVHTIARTNRIGALARIIAAQRMGLTNDPLGDTLPDDLWMQCTAYAENMMMLIEWDWEEDGIMKQDTHREYIGDGIYAAFDGHRIWLRKLDGNQIALDAPALRTLQQYEQWLRMTLTPPERIEP